MYPVGNSNYDALITKDQVYVSAFYGPEIYIYIHGDVINYQKICAPVRNANFKARDIFKHLWKALRSPKNG